MADEKVVCEIDSSFCKGCGGWGARTEEWRMPLVFSLFLFSWKGGWRGRLVFLSCWLKSEPQLNLGRKVKWKWKWKPPPAHHVLAEQKKNKKNGIEHSQRRTIEKKCTGKENSNITTNTARRHTGRSGFYTRHPPLAHTVWHCLSNIFDRHGEHLQLRAFVEELWGWCSSKRDCQHSPGIDEDIPSRKWNFGHSTATKHGLWVIL